MALADVARRITAGGKSDRAASAVITPTMEYGVVTTGVSASGVPVLLAGATTPVLLPCLANVPVYVGDTVLIASLGLNKLIVGNVVQTSAVISPTFWLDASIPVTTVGNATFVDKVGSTITPAATGALFLMATAVVDAGAAAQFQGYNLYPLLSGAFPTAVSAPSPQLTMPASGAIHMPILGLGLTLVSGGTSYTLGVRCNTGSGGAATNSFRDITVFAMLGALGT